MALSDKTQNRIFIIMLTLATSILFIFNFYIAYISSKPYSTDLELTSVVYNDVDATDYYSFLLVGDFRAYSSQNLQDATLVLKIKFNIQDAYTFKSYGTTTLTKTIFLNVVKERDISHIAQLFYQYNTTDSNGNFCRYLPTEISSMNIYFNGQGGEKVEYLLTDSNIIGTTTLTVDIIVTTIFIVGYIIWIISFIVKQKRAKAKILQEEAVEVIPTNVSVETNKTTEPNKKIIANKDDKVKKLDQETINPKQDNIVVQPKKVNKKPEISKEQIDKYDKITGRKSFIKGLTPTDSTNNKSSQTKQTQTDGTINNTTSAKPNTSNKK